MLDIILNLSSTTSLSFWVELVIKDGIRVDSSGRSCVQDIATLFPLPFDIDFHLFGLS